MEAIKFHKLPAGTEVILINPENRNDRAVGKISKRLKPSKWSTFEISVVDVERLGKNNTSQNSMWNKHIGRTAEIAPIFVNILLK